MSKLKFRVDHATTTGYDHLKAGGVSQDYCLSGSSFSFSGDFGYAIVSDGCSSGGETDIGSRLVGITTRSYVLRYTSEFGYSELNHYLNFNLRNQISELDLTIEDLYATCLVVRADPKDTNVFVYGDGVVAIQRKNGEIELVKFEWSDNSPLYPAYKPDAINQLTDAGATMTKTTIHPNGQETVELFSLEECAKGSVITLPSSDLLNVAIFSDGVEQVKNSLGDTYKWMEVVKDLLAFKNYEGVFAKRKLNNAFLPTAAKSGFKPYDDLSYGVIHFEEEEVDDGKSGG